MNRRLKLVACFLLFLLAASSLPGRGLSGAPVSSRLERPLRFPVERDFGGISAKVLKLRADLPDFMPLRLSSGFLQAVSGFFTLGRRVLLLKQGSEVASGWVGLTGLSLPVSSPVSSEDVLEVAELPEGFSVMNLSQSPAADVLTSAAVGPDGSLWVAWHSGSQGVVRRFTFGGAPLGEPVGLTSLTSYWPAVSVAPMGDSAWTVWAAGGNLSAQRLGGQTVALSNWVYGRVACAVSGERLYLVWDRNQGGDHYWSWGSISAASGDDFRRFDSSLLAHSSRPVVLPAPGGDAYIIMVTASGDGRLYVARVGPDCAPVWSTNLAEHHTSGDIECSAAVSPDGSLWVFWNRGRELWLAKLSPSGERLLTRPALVRSASNPAVACDGGGRVHLAWVQDLSSEGLGKEVFIQVLSSDGAVLAGPSNTTGCPGDDFEPVLVCGPDGVLLLWNSTRDGNREVYLRLPAPPGRQLPQGSDFFKASDVLESAALKNLAVMPDGRVWVAWASGGVGYLRSYSSSGEPLFDGVPLWPAFVPLSTGSYHSVSTSPGGFVVNPFGAGVVFLMSELYSSWFAFRRYGPVGFWAGDTVVISAWERQKKSEPIPLLHGENLWFACSITSEGSVDSYYPWVYVADPSSPAQGSWYRLGLDYEYKRPNPMAVAPGPGADVHVAYGSKSNGAFVMRMRPDGTQAWKVKVTPDQIPAVAAAGGEGGVFVAYPSGSVLKLVKYGPDGNLAGGPWEVSRAYAGGRISATLDASGNLWVAWTEDRSSQGLGREVFAAVYDSAGSLLAGPANESSSPAGDLNPILAAGSGSVWLAFESDRDARAGVFVKKLS